MANFAAVFSGVSSENASCYTFEGPENLMNRAPFEALGFAMEAVEKSSFAAHHGYELHAVSRNRDRDAIVGIGYLISGAGEIPFTLRLTRG